jgi:GST-like protein
MKYLCYIKKIRLKDNFYVAGDVYTIADMAIWPWVKPFKRWIKKSLKDESFIYADRWYEEIKIRPGVIKGLNVSKELAILG